MLIVAFFLVFRLDPSLFFLEPGLAVAGAFDLSVADEVGEVEADAPAVPTAMHLGVHGLAGRIAQVEVGAQQRALLQFDVDVAGVAFRILF